MNRRGYLTVFGGALLAGCTGSGSDAPNTDQPTTTATPTPTPRPTSTASLEDVEFPDGVTDSEITTDLLTAHRQVVLGKPYTIDSQFVSGDRLRETTLKLGMEKARQDQIGSGASSRSLYKDGNEGFVNANEGEYFFEDSPSFDRAELAELREIGDHLAAGNYEPEVAIERDGRLLIRAQASEASVGERLQQFGIESINSYRGTLHIAPNGQIVQLDYDWEFSIGGRTRAEEKIYRTRDIGETTITEPDWLGSAREEAFTFTLRGPDGNQDTYVAVDVEGGGQLPTNIFANIRTEGLSAGNAADVPLTDGDTLYLAIGQDGRLKLSKSPDFSDDRTLQGRVYVLLSINGVNVLENDSVTI